MLWYIYDSLYNADRSTENICVVGFLHQVLADILCLKTAMGFRSFHFVY